MSSVVDKAAVRASRLIDQLVEDGKLFGASPILTVDPAVNSYVTFTTGAAVRTHAYLSFISTFQAQVNVYTGATITVPGTQASLTNFFIGHSNVATGIVRTGVTAGPLGTKIADFLIPGGSGGNAVGGAVENAAKVILPPNTTFLFEFDNLAAGSPAPLEFTLNLFEVPL